MPFKDYIVQQRHILNNLSLSSNTSSKGGTLITQIKVMIDMNSV